MCFNNPAICQGEIQQGLIGSGTATISCTEDPALCGVVSQNLVLLQGPNPPSVDSLILISSVSVPEPSSLILLATGVVAIWGLVWRRRVAGRVTTPTFALSGAK